MIWWKTRNTCHKDKNQLLKMVIPRKQWICQITQKYKRRSKLVHIYVVVFSYVNAWRRYICTEFIEFWKECWNKLGIVSLSLIVNLFMKASCETCSACKFWEYNVLNSLTTLLSYLSSKFADSRIFGKNITWIEVLQNFC